MKNDFENLIDKFIDKLNKSKNNVFGWKNHPERLHTGIYIKGEPFDYCIVSEKGTHVFDAKSTHDDTWKVLKKDLNQAKNLLKCSKCLNVKAFFLIYFYKLKQYYYLDINDFFELNKKSIKPGYCDEVNIEELIL